MVLVSQAVALSLDSLAGGLIAGRFTQGSAARFYAVCFGLSDAFAALLGRSVGVGCGTAVLLAACLGVIAGCRWRDPRAGWRTALGAALPLLLGLDSLACPVSLADLPELALVSTALALAGCTAGRAARRTLPVCGRIAVLSLAALMVLI